MDKYLKWEDLKFEENLKTLKVSINNINYELDYFYYDYRKKYVVKIITLDTCRLLWFDQYTKDLFNALPIKYRSEQDE